MSRNFVGKGTEINGEFGVSYLLTADTVAGLMKL